MKHFFSLVAGVFMLSMSSQNVFIEKIELEWLPRQEFQIDQDKSWHVPSVKNNYIDLETGIPEFTKKWHVSDHMKVLDFEIKNVEYQRISREDFSDIDLNKIPLKLQPKMKVISTRKVWDAYFSLTPLIRKGSVINKIISFEVHYRLEPKSNKKSYVSSSVLATGEWYKFSVDTTGVFKIDRSFLSNMGINVSSINPQNISIYGNGGNMLPYKIGDFRYDDLQENAIYVEGEEDGVFDSNDYILFYAKGPDSWKIESFQGTISHIKNIYTDKAYYFVHIKDQAAKRITQAPIISQSPEIEFTNFDDLIVHEIDRKNLFNAGQQWLGESFDIENDRSIFMQFDNIDTAYPVSVKTRVVAVSPVSTNMEVSIDGQTLYNLNISQATNYQWAQSNTDNNSVNLNTENIELRLTYNNNGVASSKAYLDYIEIVGKKKLIVNNKQFSFRNFEMNSSDVPVSFKLQNLSNVYQLWDVTDYINPQIINNQSNTNDFSFVASGGTVREYVVLNQQDFYSPELIENSLVLNQDLHALENIEYVIITKDFLVNEAEILAQYHRDNSNLNVKVVPLYQIYNEFGSGASDITAIRDFIKFLYDISADQLKYVLLYGDASYDFKNIFESTDNIVPAFQAYRSFNMTNSYVTDDFFVIVSDPEEGDLDLDLIQTQDLAIGRIPVRTVLEAQDMNNKILNYYSEMSLGDWRNQIAMIADDADKVGDITLQTSQEALSDDIKLNKPVFNLKKIYADAYQQVISSGGNAYPEANRAIINTVEKGVLVANYFGHGGEDGLAAERLLSTQDIELWNNFNTLPLIMIISCEFARFDNPSRPNTAGELVLRNKNGAGISEIATARAVYISVGKLLNTELMPYLLEYNDLSNSISENLRLVKNENNTSSSFKQRYFVFSFGDPAMKLAVPKPDIKITHMNNIPITESLDTIKALSHVFFDGIIVDGDGNNDTNFDGVLSVTIYDKPVDKETLNNDGVAGVMVFDTQESKIFRGSASVTNGQFSFDFVAPKDIRIAYGKGKLSFYADDGLYDKAGYNLDVTVGGINEDAPEDNQGPEIQLYLNDKSFIDGGSTNQSPLLLAFFQDENGINTSLSSVDHDIVAILDDDQQNSMILNDYYTTELDDYKKGNLEYRLRNLEVGPHTLHLKAYDTYNNPSEAMINFVVLDDSELVIEHVLNYPNPFVNYTEFWFNHNKPNEPLEVQIQIYTVSGKLVKTFNQLIQNTGSLSRDIHWDGLDDFGKKIGKGVYIYKLSVKSTMSDLKTEKFEKLVILQ